jgi:hypothetical protein
VRTLGVHCAVPAQSVTVRKMKNLSSFNVLATQIFDCGGVKGFIRFDVRKANRLLSSTGRSGTPVRVCNTRCAGSCVTVLDFEGRFLRLLIRYLLLYLDSVHNISFSQLTPLLHLTLWRLRVASHLFQNFTKSSGNFCRITTF